VKASGGWSSCRQKKETCITITLLFNYQNLRMKKIIVLLLLTGQIITGYAIRVEYGNNININKPVYEDLYLAGGSITINAPVYGDLVIAGGTINISDSITGDILVAGGTVTMNGFAGDDIRCAGGNIRISHNVNGDVVITGGKVIMDEGITIGSLLASGGAITINGNIRETIKSYAGELLVNGNVAKDIECRGGKITINGNINGRSIIAARQIYIGDNTSFNSDVRYWAKNKKVDFKQSLKNGKAIYDPALKISGSKWYYLGAVSILGLLWYLGMALVMILLIQYLFPSTLKKAADIFYNTPMKSFGFGLLFFIGVPVIAVLAFISVIGVPVGLLLIFSYVVLVLLAVVITSSVLANWINNRYEKNWDYWRLAFTAFGIFIVLRLITLTPIAGWLVMILLCCAAFGSIVLAIHWRRDKTMVIDTQ
jgi:hypothetical protein